MPGYRPPTGQYLMHVQQTVPATPGFVPYDVRQEVKVAGLCTTFGVLPWEPEAQAFVLGQIACQCTGQGTFVGMHLGVAYHGTCERLGD